MILSTVPSQEFRDYCARLSAQHGARFSPKGLSAKFAPYFGRAYRLKVRFSCGSVKWGHVSGTTGWGPSLMLMLRVTSRGSSWLLSDKDEILDIRRAR